MDKLTLEKADAELCIKGLELYEKKFDSLIASEEAMGEIAAMKESLKTKNRISELLRKLAGEQTLFGDAKKVKGQGKQSKNAKEKQTGKDGDDESGD